MSNRPTIRKPNVGRTIAVVGDVYRFLATSKDTNSTYAMWEAKDASDVIRQYEDQDLNDLLTMDRKFEGELIATFSHAISRQSLR